MTTASLVLACAVLGVSAADPPAAPAEPTPAPAARPLRTHGERLELVVKPLPPGVERVAPVSYTHLTLPTN